MLNKKPKKIFIIIGTRPEAIKMAPLINKLKLSLSKFQPIICITAQHREMLDQVLHHFKIVPDYDLNIMTEGQDVFDLTSGILNRLKPVLMKESPDIVLVQGDTTTAFLGSLTAYYMRIPVGHIEAGLRTHNKYSPFPEEINRHLIGVIADYHFAPTEMAKKNLLLENINEKQIWVTGNTVIDALLLESCSQDHYWETYFKTNWNLTVSSQDHKIILVTGHRRESFGEGFRNICFALKRIAAKHPEAILVYPVHLNPNVKEPVYSILGDDRDDDFKTHNIFLIKPLEYTPFVYLMKKSYMILTDSGGIQEEAPSLGKPVLVMRKNTERPEGVEAGTCRLIGTNTDNIVNEVEKLLSDPEAYESMAKIKNPYGDGKASDRIINVLLKILNIE